MEEFFLGFPPLASSFETLAGLNDEDYSFLLAEVRGPNAFARDISRCSQLAEKVQLEIHQIFHLLVSLQFLYDRCRDWEKSDKSIESELLEFLEITQLRKKLWDNTEKHQRLLDLLQRNPTLERRRKLTWLRTGILDTAVEFASFVDLRPTFSDDRSSVEDLVPIAILKVVARSDSGEDKIHIIQLTSSGLKQLRNTIRDIEAKLSCIAKDSSLNQRLESTSTEHWI